MRTVGTIRSSFVPGAICAFLLSLLVFPARAQKVRIDPTRIVDAQQDSTGVIWGICQGRFCRWKGNQWQEFGVGGGDSPENIGALFPGADGSVLGLGNGPENKHTITWEKGTESKVVGEISTRLRQPSLSADPAGNIWVTDSGFRIYRIKPGGKPDTAYTFTPQQFQGPARPRDDNSIMYPVRTAIDGKGRTWFWSDAMAAQFNVAAVQGVLIFDGNEFSYHGTIAGLPDRKYSLVAKKDEKTMWVCAQEDGLYEVDIDTLQATRVKEPAPGAFDFVQEVFKGHDKWHLVAGRVWLPVTDRTNEGGSGTVWREDADGWVKVVDGLDSRLEGERHASRSWIEEKDGVWLDAFGSGPWFIPEANSKQTQSVLADWRSEYPLNDTLRMFKLADGNLLTVSVPDGSAVVNPADLLAAWKPSPRAQVFHTDARLARDAKGKIWMVDRREDSVLSDWDGEKWLDHPLPSGVKVGNIDQLTFDTLQRMWLIPQASRTQVSIFDPGKGDWTSFPTYTGALQAQMATNVRLLIGPLESQAPAISADGRVCFRSSNQTINYFDGRFWREWNANQIKGAGNPFDGPPYFNKAGNLAVNSEGQTWEFTEEKGWHLSSYEAGLGQYITNPSMMTSVPVIPAGCGLGEANSVVRDEDGSLWITAGGKLYKSVAGVCAPQFETDERQPFVDSRRIARAVTDNHGDAFFLTARNSGNRTLTELVILKAMSNPPKTEMRVVREGEDSARLEFSTAGHGDASFLWRIDGGPWSAPLHEKIFRLDWLANGKHTIQAEAIDQRLQIDPVPAEASIEVHVEPKAQMAAMIAALGGMDTARRENAKRALELQPDAALPALRAAEEKAQGDARWWIEATIQEIERAKNSAGKPTVN